MNRATAPSQHQQGSSLLEVMISLFVLAIGLLGALAMQTQSMQHNQSSYAFMQSVYLASDVVERIRANPNGTYTTLKSNLSTKTAATCISSCSVADLANKDFFDLKGTLDTLPQGQLEISKAVEASTSTNLYTISVYFDDTKNKIALQTGTGGGEQTYTLQVRI